MNAYWRIEGAPHVHESCFPVRAAATLPRQMRTLIEKIETDAAERLVLPAGTAPSADLARYKSFLKIESHRIKMRHRAGAGGREICQARATLIDILIRYLWQGATEMLSAQAQKEFPPLALVAFGGYGRAELNPCSDIDFMFLHDGQVVSGSKPLPHLSKLMDGILYPLWDLGFKIGYSVRTVSECVNVANSDMQSKTSLIEARLITGDERLFQRLQKAIVSKCVEGSEGAYIAERLQDQAARRARFGNSATMQEPNIKNGCGGLRDYQNLHWMAFFKYRTRTLADMEHREFISGTERKQLEAAYDFLLSVRTELHYQSNRAVDILSKSLQPAIATIFGFTDRSPSKRLEQFMREVYTHMRHIHLISRSIEERLALLPRRTGFPSIRRLIHRPFSQPEPQMLDGFRLAGGQIHAVSHRVFGDQPRRLMRVFLHAQQRGLKLHPDLAQLVRSELSLVDRSFLYDSHVRETFLEILNQRGNVAPVLRAMHEVGLLGKYIPEFGKLTCLVQHEFYHQYTADEHTLVCLEKLDRVWEANDAPYEAYTDVFESIERPFVLYLALLLHDSGKAIPTENHSAVGGQLALRVARRLGLDGGTTHSLRLVIENHLAMAQISQRRDLEDAKVIRSFANQLESAENLRMLTLHTLADSLATSDKLWNGFKDSLLRELYAKTLKLLLGGTDFIRAEMVQRELLAGEVMRLLPDHFNEEDVHAHFESLPPRYFQIHSPWEIAADLQLTHRFYHHQLDEEEKALEPAVTWHNEPDRGYTSVKICTWDRAGLFWKLAGSFSSVGINILSARIFTRSDGIVLDTFFVTDANSGNLVKREEREEFENLLRAVFAGTSETDLRGLILRRKARPLYQRLEDERIETRIDFDNDSSEQWTVIDIEAEDHLGLLYFISRTLSDLNVPIFIAKIATEKGAAIDSFYVAEADGQKISSPERQKLIEARLRAAIAETVGF